MRIALQTRISIVTLLLLMTCPTLAKSQETPADSKPSDVVQTETGLKNGYRLQETDDIAQPIQVVVPLSAAVQARNEALAWYMIGRLFDNEHRNDPAKALAAFRKAVKLDPEAIEIYRNLVPLEFAFDNPEVAVRYAMKAVQLDPDDFETLQLLALQAASSGRLPEAIKFFDWAYAKGGKAAEDLDYVPLPAPVVAQIQKTWSAEIKTADGKPVYVAK